MCVAARILQPVREACRAAGVSLSPHGLRHRPISLLGLRGMPRARIGGFVGQGSLSVTADVYSHIRFDETGFDWAHVLAAA